MRVKEAMQQMVECVSRWSAIAGHRTGEPDGTDDIDCWLLQGPAQSNEHIQCCCVVDGKEYVPLRQEVSPTLGNR